MSFPNFILEKKIKIKKNITHFSYTNPGPADLIRSLPLQTEKIQISWLLKKPVDLDLHYWAPVA